LYELIRLYTLLKQGGASMTIALPVSWYAAAPLLAIVPILFFMLASDEERFAQWLPLIALIKALGVAALAFFVAASVPTALKFAASGDLRIILPLAGDAILCVLDAILAVWCLRRSRALCR
jgi:hypothetical protein